MNKYFERLNDIAVIQLDTEGFDKLSIKQKNLAMHLAQAGLWGRFISLDQGSEYNIPLFNALISIYQNNESHPKREEIKNTLFTLFAHNGVFHSTTGQKITLPLQQSTINEFVSTNADDVAVVNDIWFSNKIAEYRTVQTDGVDVVALSGGNFYKNLTTQEVNDFRAENYPKVTSDEVPPYGFNERLVKKNDKIHCQTISENGLYGDYVKKIIESLEQALLFTENDAQSKSISTLIDFYRTGDALDFDTHCVAWTADKDSDIYYINGLIESYEDPLGIGCTFESIVAFKNPLQTAKVNKIIDNIQWFENNLPFDKKFKKDKAVGLSASSVNVISMGGETSPSLPLGINLPNSDWIRKKHGSKSVNLANVSSSRSTSEKILREALYLPEYQSLLEQYGNMTSNLHTDLHEIAGHGSGKVLEGKNTDAIGAFYSTIEECRADLVALYFMANPKLKEFGIYDDNVNVHDAAKAAYVSYLTNGSFAQLRRIELGKDLTQAHFRNRQLISNWVLHHAKEQEAVLTQENGEHYIKVNDVAKVQKLFGQLLSIIQEVKSTADFEGAKNLVMTFGTKIDQSLHAQFLSRVNQLDLPKTLCANTPMIIQKNNEIVIEQSNNFFEQQMSLYKDFFIPTPVLTKQEQIKQESANAKEHYIPISSSQTRKTPRM